MSNNTVCIVRPNAYGYDVGMCEYIKPTIDKSSISGWTSDENSFIRLDEKEARYILSDLRAHHGLNARIIPA